MSLFKVRIERETTGTLQVGSIPSESTGSLSRSLQLPTHLWPASSWLPSRTIRSESLSTSSLPPLWTVPSPSKALSSPKDPWKPCSRCEETTQSQTWSSTTLPLPRLSTFRTRSKPSKQPKSAEFKRRHIPSELAEPLEPLWEVSRPRTLRTSLTKLAKFERSGQTPSYRTNLISTQQWSITRMEIRVFSRLTSHPYESLLIRIIVRLETESQLWSGIILTSRSDLFNRLLQIRTLRLAVGRR